MLSQIIKFGIVGVIATVVDYGTLILLTDYLKVHVMIASTISFCASVIVNYLLSMAYVFKSQGQSKTKEFLVFVLLSVGGLCINQLILWIGVQFMSAYYLIPKLFASVIVPVYNFITRKLLLESKEK